MGSSIIIKLRKKYSSLNLQTKAAIWFAFCGMMQKGMQFITTPIFTRILTTAQYGKVSVYLSWYNIISIFTTLNLYMGGFNNGMIQNEDRRDEYLSSMQGLVTITTFILYVIYLLTSQLWNQLFDMSTIMVSVMFIEILIHSSILFWSAKIRFEYKYRSLLLFTIPIVMIPPIASIIAIKIFGGSNASNVKIYSNAICIIVLCLPIYIYNLRKGKSFYHKEFWKFGIQFNTPLIPHYLSGIVLNQADRIMIQKMVGDSEAGIYSLAYSASMVLNVATTAINQSLSPWIYNKLKQEEYDDIRKTSIPIFVGVAIVILMLVLFAPECIVLFGGKSYKDAIWIIPSVASSLYFLFVYQVYVNIEFYFMKNTYITYASVSGAILNIILNYFGIKLFGYIAAGYTTLLCYIVFFVCHCIFVNKIEKKYINNIHIFDNRKTSIIGIVLISCSQIVLLLYNYPLIRFVLLLGLITWSIIKRRRIKNLLNGIRE